MYRVTVFVRYDTNAIKYNENKNYNDSNNDENLNLFATKHSQRFFDERKRQNLFAWSC